MVMKNKDRTKKGTTRKTRKTRAPGVKQLGATKFEIRLYGHDPATGRRIDRIRTVECATLLEAVEIRDRLRRELDAEEAPQSIESSIFSTRARAWLARKENLKRRDGTSRLAPGTIKTYASQIETVLIPVFGHRSIESITKKDIERFRDAMGSEYKGSTVNKAVDRLVQIIEDETDRRFKVAGLDTDDARINDDEPNRFDAHEIGAFLDAMKAVHPEHYAITLWLFVTGQRPSTARVVRWTDIDREAGIVTARRRLSDEKLREGTKTGIGNRDRAPVPPELLEVLEANRDRHFNEAQRRSELVFPGPSGGPWNKSFLDRPFKEAREHAGITIRFTPKGCRRTAARLFNEATSDRVSMKVLGHATVSMNRHYAGTATHEIASAGKRVLTLIDGGLDRDCDRESGVNGTEKAVSK